MKIFIAVLIVLLVAPILAAGIQHDSGYILIAYGKTTIEMTIWVGVAVLAAVLLLFTIVFMSLRRGAKVSDKIASFWSDRKADRKSVV